MKIKDKMQQRGCKPFMAISILLAQLIAVSCKDNSVTENEELKKPVPETALVKFNFPDTVYRNKSYNGIINYESVLDTITTNVMEEVNGVDRYIVYSLRKTNTIDYDFKDLKKVRLDTFGAVNNRTIPIFDIKFTELGTFYIDGVINYHVTIDTLTKPKKATDKVRYIENEVRATHKVIVIDEPNSNNARTKSTNLKENKV